MNTHKLEIYIIQLEQDLCVLSARVRWIKNDMRNGIIRIDLREAISDKLECRRNLKQYGKL